MKRRAAADPGHDIQLLEGARALVPAMVAAVDKAEHTVHLETYIFHFEGVAQQLLDALVRAAQRGVQVRVVVDGVGTPNCPPIWRQRLLEAGVQWQVYMPLGTWGLLIPSHWRRLHRKLCVVDAQTLFCGGINVLDDWLDPRHGALPHPRLDYAVQVQGPMVLQALDMMTQLWWRMQFAAEVRKRRLPQVLQSLRAGAQAEWRAVRRVADVQGKGVRAGMLWRDNVRHRATIERAYLKALGEARHEVILANAYFLPGRRLRQALVRAAQRGVRVQVLLQGRYEYFMQYHASRAVYRSLLAAGVQIHAYTSSFLHAKVAVMDAGHSRSWATVGSSNLDPLSLLLAREANVVVHDPVFARLLRNRLQAVITHESQPVELASFEALPWHQRWRDALAYSLMRVALFLTGNRY